MAVLSLSQYLSNSNISDFIQDVPEQLSSAEKALETVLANYKEGFQYADYIPGTDKLAAAGVGALVYKLATGKAIAKAVF